MPLIPEPGLLPGEDVFPELEGWPPAPPVWRLVLADHGGTPLGEVTQATGRTLKFTLNRPPTVGFTCRVDDPLAQYLVLDDLTFVKAYMTVPNSPAGPTLMFCGPIVNHDKARATGGGSVAVLASGPAWRLSKRLIGKDANGCTLEPAVGAGTGDLVRIIIDALNACDGAAPVHPGGPIAISHAGDTNIRTPAGPIAAGNPWKVGPWYYRPALEAINEMSGVLDGFDWRVDPVEPAADGLGIKLGDLAVADAFGTLRDNAVFEFGAGRANLSEFHELGDATSLCNDACNLPPGFPGSNTQAPVFSLNSGSVTARGVYEDLVTADLTVDEMRQALVDEHAALRGIPRIVYKITPTPDLGDGTVPRYGIDYDIGDLIPFRATETFPTLDPATGAIVGYSEVKTVDAVCRVYGVELALDDNGVATPTLTILESET
jgi:hypothetical protein